MMNEMGERHLMEEALKGFESISQGNIIKGVIEKVTQEDIFINIGYKSEGIISFKEFETLNVTPQLGNEVEALVVNLDDRRGNVRLSMIEAVRRKSWESLLDAYSQEKEIVVKITGKNKGGYEAEYKDLIPCFMPLSMYGGEAAETGKEVKVLVLEVDKKKNNIVVSNKAISQKAADKAFKEIFDHKKEGDLVVGKISRLVDYGAFVDFGGFEGLMHITDISWSRVRNVSDYLNVGQEVEVQILKINETKKQVSVGLKQKSPEPWSIISEKYSKDQIVQGTVRNITDFGAFIEIEPGLEGLLHISDMAWRKVNSPKEVVKKGEKIKVKILDIDVENKKLSLSKKAITSDPWEKIEDICGVGTTVSGKVVKIINSGVFVATDNDIEGFVHISDLSWNKQVSNPGDIIKVGQEIKAKVIELDINNKKIKFGIKQLTPDPWIKLAEKYSIGQEVEGKVVNITKFGAFIEVEKDFEGLLHISDLSWTKKVNVEDVLESGQNIKVKIIELDKKEKRLALGLKQLENDPWENIKSKYQEDSIISGKVANIKKFGIFVELEPGVEGLVHINDISWTKRPENLSSVYKTGEDIKVRVLKVNPAKREIGLGIKQIEENPYEKYSEGLVVKGVVKEIKSFGLILEIEPDINGFVHISEISEDRFSKIEDVVKQGEEIDAKVIENNVSDGKIKLSIKEANYGQIAEEFILDNNSAGGVSVGEKLKRALNSKK